MSIADQGPIKNLVGNVPAALAALTFFALLLSVITEWGYFHVVGAEFQTFESATDYLANAVLYLPQNLILFFISSMLTFFLFPKRFFARRTPTGSQSRMSNILILGIFIAFMGALAIAPYVAYSLGYIDAALLNGIWFILFVYAVLAVLRVRYEWFRAYDIRLVSTLLVLLFASFVLGSVNARRDLAEIRHVFFIPSGSEKRPVVLLRSFDKGILVMNHVDSAVEFIKWDEVARVSLRKYPDPPQILPACRKFGWLCPSTPGPP